MAQIPSIVREVVPRRDHPPGHGGPSWRARHAVPLRFDQRRARSCRGLPGSRSPGLRVPALRTPPQLTLFLLLLLSATTAFAQFETKLTASDARGEDYFGEAVAISGDYVIVGVRTSDDGVLENAGAAYFFERTGGKGLGGAWQQVAKLTPPDRQRGRFFGESVAIDGEYALVGAIGDNERGQGAGAVYACQRIAGEWQIMQKITVSGAEEGQFVGWEVALDGNRAVIGAPRDDQLGIQVGAAYVLVRENGEWVEQQKLLPRSGLFASFFGTTIGLDGDRLIVGSPTDAEAGPQAGAAHVFELRAGRWQRIEKLLPPPVTPPDSVVADTFAREVALNGDWAFVGSGDDEQCILDDMLINPDEPNFCTSGAVFAYQRQQNGDWELQQKIAPEELEQLIYSAFSASPSRATAPSSELAATMTPAPIRCPPERTRIRSSATLGRSTSSS